MLGICEYEFGKEEYWRRASNYLSIASVDWVGNYVMVSVSFKSLQDVLPKIGDNNIPSFR
jgi:hypothetical protein